MNIEMNIDQKALKWAYQYLKTHHKTAIQKHERIVETAYSIVYQITTRNLEFFYLKITPKSLFLESAILQKMNARGCLNIPMVLAEENHLHCFLMPSCGTQSLRQLFHKNKAMDLKLLKEGIDNYTKIQRNQENETSEWLSLGIPDWGLEQFPKLYDELIGQEDLLLWDGLTQTEISQLQTRSSLCEKLCQELSTLKLPPTLSHSDYHENNMLHDPKTHTVNLIDWGETVISHPFFSLNGCLWNLGYFHGLKTDDPMYTTLRYYAIFPWLADFKERSLLKAWDLSHHLLGIYAALAYQRMYKATDHLFNTIQQKHRGAIAGCLRTFLSVP